MTFITIDQIAAMLNVSKRTVFRLKHTESKFPQPIIFSRRNVRYKAVDVEAYITRKLEAAK